jgi:putative transcriptional regulator
MRNSIKEAVSSTIKDMIKADLNVSFTQKELKKLGIEVTPISINADDIKSIRKSLGVSQAVFAKLLNVSISAVRQWEQNLRKPSGSTMVLLELLKKEPKILDYRINLDVA